MIYKCIRCHYSTEVKGNYKTHLLRKRPCDPIFSNTSCEELKIQLDDGKYKLPEPTNPNNNDDELQVDIEKLSHANAICDEIKSSSFLHFLGALFADFGFLMWDFLISLF